MKRLEVAVSVVLAVVGFGFWGLAQAQQGRGATAVNKATMSASQRGVPAGADNAPLAEVGPSMSITIGKSVLMRLPGPIERISVGNPAVADVTLISSRELYLLGKTFGSTNVIMWRKGGPTTIIDIGVSMDSVALADRLRELLPSEKDITVHTAADAVVLSGTVSSALMADYAMSLAEAFARTFSRGFTLPITAGSQDVDPGAALKVAPDMGGGMARGAAGPKVINMMRIAQPQQVMLEVKVAEISKNLLDKLGVGIDAARISGSWRYSILSSFLTDSSGVLGLLSRTGNSVRLDATKKDGLIRVLAEPNIVSISGQEASFLAGGKIFLPVARANSALGTPAVTLEEKEFGVGLKFTPTVLDGGRINLKVAPEVSELSQTGSAFSTINGQTSVLPSFTTRRAQTTVQLMDGQSFAIAGLIKNNVSETINRFPFIGDVPIIGALFRSNEFQTDRTELMFVVTARLVKPLPGAPALPTDNFIPPNREEFFWRGQLEGSGHPEVPPPDALGAERQRQASPASGNAAGASQGGFQLK